MAIQPIDLSTIYSQLDNIGKFSAMQNQSAQLAAQQNLAGEARADLAKTRTVNKTPSDDSFADGIKDEGGGSSDFTNAGEQHKKEDEQDAGDKPRQTELKDPHTGNFIDIMG